MTTSATIPSGSSGVELEDVTVVSGGADATGAGVVATAASDDPGEAETATEGDGEATTALASVR